MIPVIDHKRDRKQQQADHEQRAVMYAAANDLTHLLRDDPGN